MPPPWRPGFVSRPCGRDEEDLHLNQRQTEMTMTDEATPAKPTIEYDDFTKLDLRVAKVIEVSEHPNADKLLVLKVDLGDEQRTICAGIKAFYSPEALLGKTVVLVANLAPRKMRGIESQGMLLAATVGSREALDDVVVLTTDKDTAPPGSVCS
ncbi:MAG: methionine--tRNA ligase subunit beta [Planctomycetes bacterium]|nr:methionine--tRNA ligase subunit beta [Phycisphaerae bacterium]NBB94318.1 methionine--tRNA ligase subunit beta [Planctomycetota bacterium]